VPGLGTNDDGFVIDLSLMKGVRAGSETGLGDTLWFS
jgi:hypothetical protein